MEMVFHYADRYDADAVLESHAAEYCEKYDAIIISVEDESAVDGNLENVLEAIPVEFSFWCHSFKI